MKAKLLVGLSAALPVALLGADAASEAEEVDAVRIFAGTSLYPQGLAERGVQGTVTIRADLSPEGAFSNPTIQESSRSAELDSAALALVPRLTYRLSKSAEGPMPSSVIVPVTFTKDSLERLTKKTCADFNVDADYFKGAFPEKPLTDMPVFDITAGTILFTVKAEQRTALARNLKQIKERIVAGCAESPDERFMDVALSVTKESL